MRGFCDSCEENADNLFDLTRLPDFRDIVRRLNYRKVCQSCYDDLSEEVRQQDEQSAERRVETRYPLRLRIDITGVDREGHKFAEQTFTEDVSLTGTRITTSHDIEAGNVLTLNVPEFGLEAAVIVELIWHNDSKRNAGLKLVDASENWTKLIKEHAISRTK
jgi:hypothetical protein